MQSVLEKYLIPAVIAVVGFLLLLVRSKNKKIAQLQVQNLKTGQDLALEPINAQIEAADSAVKEAKQEYEDAINKLPDSGK